MAIRRARDVHPVGDVRRVRLLPPRSREPLRAQDPHRRGHGRVRRRAPGCPLPRPERRAARARGPRRAAVVRRVGDGPGAAPLRLDGRDHRRGHDRPPAPAALASRRGRAGRRQRAEPRAPPARRRAWGDACRRSARAGRAARRRGRHRRPRRRRGVRSRGRPSDGRQRDRRRAKRRHRRPRRRRGRHGDAPRRALRDLQARADHTWLLHAPQLLPARHRLAERPQPRPTARPCVPAL